MGAERLSASRVDKRRTAVQHVDDPLHTVEIAST